MLGTALENCRVREDIGNGLDRYRGLDRLFLSGSDGHVGRQV
jgi:hypothetical protein